WKPGLRSRRCSTTYRISAGGARRSSMRTPSSSVARIAWSWPAPPEAPRLAESRQPARHAAAAGPSWLRQSYRVHAMGTLEALQRDLPPGSEVEVTGLLRQLSHERRLPACGGDVAGRALLAHSTGT